MKTLSKKGILKIVLIVALLLSFTGVTAEVLDDSLWVDTNMCSVEDPKTGLTCDEMDENGDQDIYYVVTSSHLDDDIWESAHQDKETARWNFWRTKFIVKYNASEVPRSEFGLDKALGAPMNHEEILAYLVVPEHGFLDPMDYDYATLMPFPPVEELPLPPEELLPLEPLPEEPLPETPTEELPTDETPTDETPEENPTDETPTDEQPTDETTDENPDTGTSTETPGGETETPGEGTDTTDTPPTEDEVSEPVEEETPPEEDGEVLGEETGGEPDTEPESESEPDESAEPTGEVLP